MKFTPLLFLFFFRLILLHSPVKAQPGNPGSLYADTTKLKMMTIPAGKQFQASGWKQFWWGEHWRPEWLKPVSFPYFDITTALGGLTPLKRGGGHQTKSLRMISKDGKEYILRTIDKDLELLIPEDFKGSYINDIINDQISTAHPYGPLAISSLAGSIGCLHTNPVIVFVPDEPALGEYRADFANKLCLFEERPSGDGWENTALTNYASDVVNTEKLYEKLQSDNDRKVNQKEFLKVRFLDMIVNDWDRHPDQWVWTGHKKNGKTTFTPFARDRDQAFSKTDGVMLYFLSRPWMLRSVRNMDANIKDIIGTNLAAVSLDKQFTNELKKEDWEATIQLVKQSLSDADIKRAVNTMPKEITAMSGAFIEKKLRQRRDNMSSYGMRYYKIINKKVTIAGSDQKELFTINKMDGQTTAITIQKAGKDQTGGDTLFHRVFTKDITREINLYGLGADDKFVYTGNAKNKIYLRALGGDGQDEYTNNTGSNGSGKKSRIYDSKDNTIKLNNDFKVRSTNDTSYTNYKRRSFKYDWYKPLIIPNFNPDDGFILGLAFTYRKQQWNKTPFAWEQTIGGTIATGTSAIGIYYNGLFKHALGKWDITLAASLKAPKFVLNYYGFGNDTKLQPQQNRNYYRVRSSGYTFSPGVSREWKKSILKAALAYESVKIEPTPNKFITNTIIDPSIFKTKNFTSANVAYTFSSIGRQTNPNLGFGFHLGAAYTMNIQQTERDFFHFNGHVKGYLPLFKGVVFAHRTGFATNSGDYEFYQGNSMGNTDYLRGYWRTRFTGETSFYQNTELRVQLAKLKGYYFMGKMGIFGFFDNGRVWAPNETSDKMHIGYGAGIYFAPFNMMALNISYGVSDEAKIFAVRTGFFF